MSNKIQNNEYKIPILEINEEKIEIKTVDIYNFKSPKTIKIGMEIDRSALIKVLNITLKELIELLDDADNRDYNDNDEEDEDGIQQKG
jgi:hypothetical protein